MEDDHREMSFIEVSFRKWLSSRAPRVYRHITKDRDSFDIAIATFCAGFDRGLIDAFAINRLHESLMNEENNGR